jgi:uncharacterized protein
MVAALKGVTNPVTYLADGGAHLELKDPKGNTALMIACGNRHLNIMEELLEKGADPNTRDFLGRTPLMLLSVLGEDEMIRLMLKYEADPTLMDFSLKTALAYAKDNWRKAVIRVLTEEAGVKY